MNKFVFLTVIFIVFSAVSHAADSRKESDYIPQQVEIEVQYVEFELSDIEPLAMMGIVDAVSLKSLWKDKKGKLLAAPKVIAQSGAEATVKSVKEVVYPTELIADYPRVEDSTNSTININFNEVAIVPAGFEVREVGVLLSVLPEVSQEGDLINLTLAPELCHEAEWKDYKASYTDSKGKNREAKIEQPFFHTQQVSTSVMIKNGATVLIGGGMPSTNKGMVVYVLVTARLVNTKGESTEPE